MGFDPEIAAIRYGYGLSPRLAPPESAAAMLGALAGPDGMAEAWPIPSFASLGPEMTRLLEIREDFRAKKPAAVEETEALREKDRERHGAMLRANLARSVAAPDAFRERLTRFWADHFTVIGRGGLSRNNTAMFVEEAIRPHLAGRFAEMLKAATTHPLMLVYLDQVRSVGPNSKAAKKRAERGRAAGLNENLAREVLELHTLGVGGAYTQADVRQLAELFAGLSMKYEKGFRYLQQSGEPGPETVLGRSYGGEEAKLEDVYAALEDIAVHPDTARHIGRKLAVHFVADDPPEELAEAIAARFAETGGDLMACYGAMLEHPGGWAPLAKAKQPFDFIASALRALGVSGEGVAGLDLGQTRQTFQRPMQFMGQPWGAPNGPNGWPEEAQHWITPQGLAVRINWAMKLDRFKLLKLPDPRELVTTALGGQAGERLRLAAGAAEDKGEGVAVVLASPDFQKR